MRGAVLASIVLGLVVLPSSAQAAQTFGADLSQNPLTGCVNTCSIQGFVHADGTAETGSPSSGILTRVRLKYRGDGGSGRFAVLQRQGMTFNFLNVGPEMPFSVPATGLPGVIYSFAVRRPIAAGDRLALIAAATLTGLTPSFESTDRYYAFGAPRRSLLTSGEHGVGDTETYSDMADLELLIEGTVEPDVDGDGFGDDTQDRCPATSGPAAGCARRPPATGGGGTGTTPRRPSNAFRFGKVRGSVLVLRVPGPGRVKVADARATASAARRKRRKALIRRRVVQAKKAGLVKIRLKPTRRGKKRLRRRGRLRTRVRVTYTPTKGTPLSKTKRVTLKAKRKRPRR